MSMLQNPAVGTCLKTDRAAVTAVEYSLIVVPVAGAVMAGISLVSVNMAATFTSLAGTV
jgi:Flp pilus assembly pilin Flp